MIAKIATGEIEDVTTEDGKNAAAVALGRMGGKARAARLSARKRKQIAKAGARARWGKLTPSNHILTLMTIIWLTKQP